MSPSTTAGPLTSRERMLAALDCRPVDRPPAWIMRQAGRYLPEYRELRKRHAFMESVHDPALAAEITLQPLRRFPLDAAIIFSDILIALEAAGLSVDVEAGEGPRIRPALEDGDPARLAHVDAAAAFPWLVEALRQVRAGLGEDRALLGFAGAPFTLACYAIEGGGSTDFARARILMAREPERFRALLESLADVAADLLLLQARAGCDAVQLFDTWAGMLSPEDYLAFAAPASGRVIRRVREAGCRVILYLRDGAHLLGPALDAGATAVGCDWRVDMADAARRASGRCALQGNVDPFALYGPASDITRRVRALHAAVGGRTGHVFNLGHGITPGTPIEGVEAFLAAVHGLGPA